jgi:tRNA A37 threonylcarbamoyladenosine synthetase subunit TsaC/SUA5/YrdC
LPSTVVDLTGPTPRVLRWGALAEAALRPVLEEVAA